MTQLDLLTYPNTAGWKSRDTSKSAAVAVEGSGRASTLRAEVKALFTSANVKLTADECAGLLHESVLSIRPRLTELGKQQVIKDSGQRRQNESGRAAIVWTMVSKVAQSAAAPAASDPIQTNGSLS